MEQDTPRQSDSWQVSKVSSGDMEKEILQVNEIWAIAVAQAVRGNIVDSAEEEGAISYIETLKNIAIEAIKQKYQR